VWIKLNLLSKISFPEIKHKMVKMYSSRSVTDTMFSPGIDHQLKGNIMFNEVIYKSKCVLGVDIIIIGPMDNKQLPFKV